MEKVGYIKLYRSIMDNWIYSCEPFCKGLAWVDLLLQANYSPKKKLYRGQIQLTRAGQIQTSIVALAERWKWDKRKVSRFLSVLEKDGMISKNGTANGTTITIENWSKWQGDGTADGTADGTPDGTPDGTHNKNIKNIKNPPKPPRGAEGGSLTSTFDKIMAEMEAIDNEG